MHLVVRPTHPTTHPLSQFSPAAHSPLTFYSVQHLIRTASVSSIHPPTHPPTSSPKQKEEEDLLLGRFPFSLSILEHMQGVGLPFAVAISPQGQAFITTGR